jgi:quercetin dioxygenase-like cupin family protein
VADRCSEEPCSLIRDAAENRMAMTTIASGFVRSPGEGEALWVIGGLYTFKALASETDRGCTVIEVRAPESFVIPVHLHEEEGEGFYVAEGEVTFFLGIDKARAGAGSFAYGPKNVEHSFRFEKPGTKLILFFAPCNGGHEGLFRELGEPAPGLETPPPPERPPDLERLGQIAARHGTRMVGPPPEA